MRSIKVNFISSEYIGKYTISVTVDNKLFEYKTKEEIAEMIEREIMNTINKSIPLNNIKCRCYSFEGRCLGEKWAPNCPCSGDASKCELLKW